MFVVAELQSIDYFVHLLHLPLMIFPFLCFTLDVAIFHFPYSIHLELCL
jgi:hypothetical protein